MSQGPRHHGRVYALQILYASDGSDEVDVVSAAERWHQQFELPVEGEAHEFASRIVRAAAERRAAIDEVISAASKNWRLERMSRVDRNILRLGACELMAFSDVPVRVSINEAVELAKRFGTTDSPAFVNGILDRIAAAIGRTPDR
ncbi:MAG: transcription antitermination factor NusB [Kofleriaceae bacterium]